MLEFRQSTPFAMSRNRASLKAELRQRVRISKAITRRNRHVGLPDALTRHDRRTISPRRGGACEPRSRRKSFTDARFSAPTAPHPVSSARAAAAVGRLPPLVARRRGDDGAAAAEALSGAASVEVCSRPLLSRGDVVKIASRRRRPSSIFLPTG